MGFRLCLGSLFFPLSRKANESSDGPLVPKFDIFKPISGKLNLFRIASVLLLFSGILI